MIYCNVYAQHLKERTMYLTHLKLLLMMVQRCKNPSVFCILN